MNDGDNQYLLQAVAELAANIEMRRIWRMLLEDIEYRMQYVAKLRGDGRNEVAQTIIEICSDDESRQYFIDAIAAAEDVIKDPERTQEIISAVRLKTFENVDSSGERITPEKRIFSEHERDYYRGLLPYLVMFVEDDDLRQLITQGVLDERNGEARRAFWERYKDHAVLTDVMLVLGDSEKRHELLEILEIADYIAALPELVRRSTIAQLKVSVGGNAARIATSERKDH